MELNRFSEIIEPLIYAYGKMDTERIGVYYRYLQGIPEQKLEQAIDKAIQDYARLPFISEILDMIYEIPSEIAVWEDLYNSFVDSRYKLQYELSKIILKDKPKLGEYPEAECRTQVYYSYKHHSQQMKKALKSGEAYLPHERDAKQLERVKVT